MNIALILIAGSGTRVGGDVPKQFLKINRKPLYIYTVQTFVNHPQIDAIVLVTHKDYISEVDRQVLNYNLAKINHIIEGGASRQESVRCGLKVIATFAKDDDIVLIHDGARPFVSEHCISNNIELAREFGAVETAIPSPNTIAISNDGLTVASVPDRRQFYIVQTPQSFKFSIINRVHQNVLAKGVEHAFDDASLALMEGYDVRIAKGESINFKITTFDDLSIAKSVINLKEGRKQ